MKKAKRKTPSRRRQALGYLVYLTAAVLFLQHVLHVGLLLPIQAIREVEEREGAHGQVVARFREPAVHRTGLFYLTENEDMVLLGNTYLSLLGWTPGFGWALDCSGGGPLHAARSSSARDGGETVWHFYGRIDSPEIETVEISLRGIAGYDEEKQEELYEERQVLSAGREDWLEKDGRRFFLLRYEAVNWPGDGSMHPFAVGRDAAGMAVTEFSIEEGIHSFYG